MGADKVKIGIVGCGFITRATHIPNILKVKDAEITAICDVNKETAETVARELKLKKSYTDFTQMLAGEKLDAVDICTSINTHAPLAIQALEAGVHVLVEKPMAINGKEADAALAAAKKSGLNLCVIHNMLFLPAVEKIKSIIKKGTLGELIRVVIVQSTPPQDYPPVLNPNHWYHKLPGGIFGDNLPHPIYLMREFIGDIEPLAVIKNKVGKLAHLKYDEVQIPVKGTRGFGTIISSCNYPSLWQIDIYGTKKSIHANLNNSYVITYGGKSMAGKGLPLQYARENLNRSFQILGDSINTGMMFLSGKTSGHGIEITKFIESVRTKTKSPVTAEDGRDVVQIWDKITSQI
jgi:predicted dehydrogenase